ncbi:sensor histidine kinase [Natronococcus jeotgali]|uniref:histidine kinase n=1 Tax=Natronococcus jeotgali DSM 18795 TaxID=1227498 RepID=L9XRC2_9EURY|nr:ATP-binding protein [Natronococcus jeotgali]ELY64062.1 multi-sensor signal transduction histidine kinase [Natronococcus jeotgali DSM 18795]
MGERSGSTTPGSDGAARTYERITDAVLALDGEFRITFCNAGAERVLDASGAQLRGTAIQEAVPNGVGATVREGCEHALETQESLGFEEYFDSLAAWYELRVYPDETAVTVHFRDVTDRVRREDQLRRRERALQDAYEALTDANRPLSEQIEVLLSIVRETLGTECGALSSVQERTNEYTLEAVDAAEGTDLEAGRTVPLDRTNCKRVVDAGRTVAIEDVGADPDAPEPADGVANGAAAVACYLGTPIFVDGSVYGTFCFYDREPCPGGFSDWERTFVGLLANWVGYKIERRRYRERLEASNEQLEQFAYAASHDLQEPLRMVSSYLSLLERRYDDDLDAEAREFLAYAVDGADRMREMIDGLLAYSRVETRGDPFEPVDLETVLADVVDDLQFRLEETEATVSIGSLPRVEGDDDQLRQVFQNLLENAVEYSGDEPPTVRITADRETASGSTPDGGESVSRGDGRWVISVSDAGIGIEPDDHERVFDVFERLHSHEAHAGTGIGLALCQRVVERHGGEIWIEPDPEEGTTFRLTLPDASSGTV